MVVITEVQFAHESGALAGTFGALPDLAVTVIRETSTDPEGNVYHLRFDEYRYGEIRPVLEDDHTVHSVERVSEFDDGCLCGVEFTDGTRLLAPRVTSEGGFVIDARSPATERHRKGWYERWLLPDHGAIHDIWQHAREEGFEFEVIELYSHEEIGARHRSVDALTDEQHRTLVAAYEAGYFAEPRETSLEELAETLDRSASAVGGRLRRGLKALVGETLVTSRHRD